MGCQIFVILSPVSHVFLKRQPGEFLVLHCTKYKISIARGWRGIIAYIYTISQSKDLVRAEAM